MATMTLSDTALRVRFRLIEKIAGLVRDLDVPLSAVTGVVVEQDGVAAARGIRAPGLAVPWLRKIGTWRGRRGKTLVSVHRGRPALRITLAGQRFDELLIGADDATGLAERLLAHTG